MTAGAIKFNRNIEDSGCRFSLARCAGWGTVLSAALGFVCFWHLADKRFQPSNVRFWARADKGRVTPDCGLSANDP